MYQRQAEIYKTFRGVGEYPILLFSLALQLTWLQCYCCSSLSQQPMWHMQLGQGVAAASVPLPALQSRGSSCGLSTRGGEQWQWLFLLIFALSETMGLVLAGQGLLPLPLFTYITITSAVDKREWQFLSLPTLLYCHHSHFSCWGGCSSSSPPPFPVCAHCSSWSAGGGAPLKEFKLPFHFLKKTLNRSFCKPGRSPKSPKKSVFFLHGLIHGIKYLQIGHVEN